MKYIISESQYIDLINSKKKKTILEIFSKKIKNIDENVKNKLMANKLKDELLEEILKNDLINEEDVSKKLI